MVKYENIKLYTWVTYKDGNEIKTGPILKKFESYRFKDSYGYYDRLECFVVSAKDGYELLFVQDYKTNRSPVNKIWCFSNSTRYIDRILKGIKPKRKKSDVDYSGYSHMNNKLRAMKREDSVFAITNLINQRGFVYIKKDYKTWEKCSDFRFEKGLHGRTYLVSPYSRCRLDRIGRGYKIMKGEVN